MNDPTLNLTPRLTFLGREVQKTEPDWVHLWEILSDSGPAILLESGGAPEETAQWTFLAGKPLIEIFGKGESCWRKEEGGTPVPLPSGKIFDLLDRTARETEDLGPFPLNLAQSWFGAMGYGFHRVLGPSWDLSFRSPLTEGLGTGIPDHHFFKPGIILAYDRRNGELFRFGERFSTDPRGSGSTQFKLSKFRPRNSRDHYQGMVQKAQGYISRGDIYQANLAQSFEGRMEGKPSELYRVLRGLNPGPFMGLFQGEGFALVSSSPERLVSGRGTKLETRPIAGTKPRGITAREDEWFRKALRDSEKEQAEHLMLVDLARNDLGRVAEYGSVHVKSLAGVESYAKVHHLVSVVEADLREGESLTSVLRSIFPGGTITGCPKFRCMQIIEELEGRSRGFYTGSMGYISPGPCFDLNILIRTFTFIPDGRFELFAGAGIVADSIPGQEYLETLYKVEALAAALGTTLLEGKG